MILMENSSTKEDIYNLITAGVVLSNLLFLTIFIAVKEDECGR